MRSIGDDELRSMDAVFCGDTPHPAARRRLDRRKADMTSNGGH